jgi:hypothetical protein
MPEPLTERELLLMKRVFRSVMCAVAHMIDEGYDLGRVRRTCLNMADDPNLGQRLKDAEQCRQENEAREKESRGTTH